MRPEPSSEIVDYIRANRGRYNRVVVERELRSAGHSAAAIRAGWEVVEQEPPQVIEAAVREQPGFWVAFVGFFVCCFCGWLIALRQFIRLNGVFVTLCALLALSALALVLGSIFTLLRPTRAVGWGLLTGGGILVGLGVVVVVFVFVISGICSVDDLRPNA